jgi:hypothetical protein
MLRTQVTASPHAVRFEVAQGHHMRYSLEFVSPCYFHRTLDGKRAGLELRTCKDVSRQPGKRRAGNRGNEKRLAPRQSVRRADLLVREYKYVYAPTRQQLI